MKKIVMSLALLMSMGMSHTMSYAGGEMMDDAMYNPYYEQGLSLEKMQSAAKDRSIKNILADNFEMIAQNTVYENYEYNAVHYETTQVNYSLFIPNKLQSKVRNISIEINNSFVDYIVPFEDSKLMNDEIQVNVLIDIKEFEGETITGSIELPREGFPVTEEFGNAFTLQVYLTLSDKSVIPYSQLGYLYVYGNSLEGKKTSLSNAYYNLQQNIGYPDLQRLLQNAFTRLEQDTSSAEEYIKILRLVEEKATSMIEKYTQIGDEIAQNVINEDTFQNNIDLYGKNMLKINLLYDAIWQIRTEIETRNSIDIIDELFSDY